MGQTFQHHEELFQDKSDDPPSLEELGAQSPEHTVEDILADI